MKPYAPSNGSARSSASYADQQTLIAGHVVAADVRNDGAAAGAVEHIWNEPLADVRRQVPDDIATWCVYPNAWVISPRRIRDQDQLVSRAEPMQDFGTLSEHRSIYRGIELGRSGKDGRHTQTM
jgi:hypothetical protein